jgi:hypothetical protein
MKKTLEMEGRLVEWGGVGGLRDLGPKVRFKVQLAASQIPSLTGDLTFEINAAVLNQLILGSPMKISLEYEEKDG